MHAHAHAHAVVTAVWHGAAACPVTPQAHGGSPADAPTEHVRRLRPRGAVTRPTRAGQLEPGWLSLQHKCVRPRMLCTHVCTRTDVGTHAHAHPRRQLNPHPSLSESGDGHRKQREAGRKWGEAFLEEEADRRGLQGGPSSLGRRHPRRGRSPPSDRAPRVCLLAPSERECPGAHRAPAPSPPGPHLLQQARPAALHLGPAPAPRNAAERVCPGPSRPLQAPPLPTPILSACGTLASPWRWGAVSPEPKPPASPGGQPAWVQP